MTDLDTKSADTQSPITTTTATPPAKAAAIYTDDEIAAARAVLSAAQKKGIKALSLDMDRMLAGEHSGGSIESEAAHKKYLVSRKPAAAAFIRAAIEVKMIVAVVTHADNLYLYDHRVKSIIHTGDNLVRELLTELGVSDEEQKTIVTICLNPDMYIPSASLGKLCAEHAQLLAKLRIKDMKLPIEEEAKRLYNLDLDLAGRALTAQEWYFRMYIEKVVGDKLDTLEADVKKQVLTFP